LTNRNHNKLQTFGQQDVKVKDVWATYMGRLGE